MPAVSRIKPNLMSKKPIHISTLCWGGGGGEGGRGGSGNFKTLFMHKFLDMDQVHVHVVNNLVQDSWLPNVGSYMLIIVIQYWVTIVAAHTIHKPIYISHN